MGFVFSVLGCLQIDEHVHGHRHIHQIICPFFLHSYYFMLGVFLSADTFRSAQFYAARTAFSVRGYMVNPWNELNEETVAVDTVDILQRHQLSKFGH